MFLANSISICLVVQLMLSSGIYVKGAQEPDIIVRDLSDELIDLVNRDLASEVEDLVNPDLPGFDLNHRYVGYCQDAYIRMWPGNSRRFWSYGYVLLTEAYPGNCSMKYIYDTRTYPDDALATFGFKVTGTFIGPDVTYDDCTDTDYIMIDDTMGTQNYYCGTNAEINWSTSSGYFEFSFKSTADTPRARGFLVTIESYYVCGGTYSSESKGPEGFIISPLYPDNYLPNTACAWYFSGPEESAITVECEKFELENVTTLDNGTSYYNDYLSFNYEGTATAEDSKVTIEHETTVYAGTDLDHAHHTIYSAGQTLLMTFRSDSENEYKGFRCHYSFIKYGS